MKYPKLLTLLLILVSLHAAGQSPRRHGKLSKLPHIKTHTFAGGQSEVYRVGNDTAVLNLNNQTGKYKGQILKRKEKYSWKLSYLKHDRDSVEFLQVLTTSLICVDYILPDTSKKVYIKSETVTATPSWQTFVGCPAVVYDNYDGFKMKNANWCDTAVNIKPSNFTVLQKASAFKLMDIFYCPFSINLTTDSNIYKAANIKTRWMSVSTPTWQWYGYLPGGVSYTGTWDRDGVMQAYSPSFIFEPGISGDPFFDAAAMAHETAHCLGLQHHGIYNPDCSKNSSYYDHKGQGQTSVSYIEGSGYYGNSNQWSFGSQSGNTCNDTLQNDTKIITSDLGVKFRADEVGNTFKSGKSIFAVSNLLCDSAIITPNDTDVFKVNVSGILKLNIKPQSIDTATNSHAMLKVKLWLVDSTGMVLAIDTPVNRLDASITLQNVKGTVGICIAGQGFDNQVDYGYKFNRGHGSIGRFYLYGKVIGGTTPPVDCSTFHVSITNSNPILCQKSTAILSANSSMLYSWFGSSGGLLGTSQSITVSPLMNTTYTVTATSNSGCTSTATSVIVVNPLPTITIQPNKPSKCQTQTISLSAVGAAVYSWIPVTGLATATSATTLCTASQTTTYTITGTSSQSCVSTSSVVVQVNPLPTITINSSQPNPVCPGATLSLTASGGSSYQWSSLSPIQTISGASILLNAPLGGGNFKVIGTDNNGCTSSSSYTITTKDCTPPPNCCTPVLSYTSTATTYNLSWTPAYANAKYVVWILLNGHWYYNNVTGLIKSYPKINGLTSFKITVTCQDGSLRTSNVLTNLK